VIALGAVAAATIVAGALETFSPRARPETVLVTGLQRDLHALRLTGLALLGVTVAKVFLFDLATLSSMYRVVSFIGLGLLLLAGAFVWQRLRPRALPDMREAPEGIR
jgi:uncharacterized membrane protein